MMKHGVIREVASPDYRASRARVHEGIHSTHKLHHSMINEIRANVRESKVK